MPNTTGYLLDTNIVVQLIRANKLGRHIDKTYDLRSTLNRCMICVVTVGELNSLARKFGWGGKKAELLHKLLDELVWLDINHPRILDAYGEIDHASELAGQAMGKNDVWIAATAKATGTILLTTDKDFDHLDPNQINRIWIDPNSGKA